MIYAWDGEAMTPLPYFRKQADKVFIVGKAYRLAEVEPRSMQSHRHFFACINEAWANLPEEYADRFRTPDELRKWALTFTEYRDVREYQAKSHNEALRIAKFLTDGPDYVRVEVDGASVTEYRPRSQAVANMDSREFGRSKQQVLDVLAEKIGVTVEELQSNAGRAA